MTYYKFIKFLIDHFKHDFRRSQIRPSKSLSEKRLNNKLHILDVEGKKQDCIVYSLREMVVRQANYFYSTCIKRTLYIILIFLLQICFLISNKSDMRMKYQIMKLNYLSMTGFLFAHFPGKISASYWQISREMAPSAKG